MQWQQLSHSVPKSAYVAELLCVLIAIVLSFVVVTTLSRMNMMITPEILYEHKFVNCLRFCEQCSNGTGTHWNAVPVLLRRPDSW